MVFCNTNIVYKTLAYAAVTILILIDGFLQLIKEINKLISKQGHNPYFNRWFSAIP